MLTRMEYHLQQGLPLSCHSASLFQGMLMQRIEPVYGEILHRSELKPYSQYLNCQANHTVWVLQTLTDDAGNQLITKPRLLAGDTIYLERLDMVVKITAVQRKSLSHEELLQQTFFQSVQELLNSGLLHPPHSKYRDATRFIRLSSISSAV